MTNNKIQMTKIPAIFLAIFLLFGGYAFCQDRLEAELEMSHVSVGNPLYLYLTFHGAQDVKAPEVPPMDGLKIKYVGPSTKITVINGKVSKSVTHTYLIFPTKSGEFTIGPFFADHNGEMYKADTVDLAVNQTPGSSRGSGATSPGPSITSSSGGNEPPAEPYVSDRVFLVMEVDKREVYINEVISLTLKLYVNQMGLKNIEYPVIPHEGFSAGGFGEPQRSWEMFRGTRYDVLVFRQDIFGIKEGDYVLGPARMKCTLMIRSGSARRSARFGISIFDDDFFSSRFNYKSYPIELLSEEIPVVILPVPKKGKPADYQGGVGDFTLDVDVEPKNVKVGDPITVRMTIGGRGNLDTVTAPTFGSLDGFKTYEPQVSKKGYQKTYEQVLIPKTADIKEVPEVSLSFFNPHTKKYETLRKGPFKIEIVKGPETEAAVKMVAMPGTEKVFYPEEKFGEDIIHIKENIGRLDRKDSCLYSNPVFWGGQVLPLVIFAVFFVQYREKQRIRTDESYARFLKAPRKARKGIARAGAYLAKGDETAFYDTIFKTLQDYLGGRFGLPKGSVTSQIVDEKLRPAGCDEDMMDMLRDVFSKCEVARYASFIPGEGDTAKVLEEVKKVIVYLERIRL